MLPTWLSDLRGASLGLLLACAAHAAGWRCAPLVYGLLGVCSVGFGFSIAFYVHTTRVVFNRKPNRSLGAYYQHFMLTRPLEAAWRFLTAPLRVLPDFHILGETRTGTTTLSSYLREIGCIGAFSPWIVPFASDKESFYFAGHYFGFVHPAAYRMCFPLKITMWLRRLVYGKASPVFDGCASHLNAPWAAKLIHSATPGAALVVLLRPPAEQNVSWWKLEMGAHAWARGMGMGEDFLVKGYPPRSLRAAFEFSTSAETE
ncbi:unnamed protein product, partial [Prorocentrum cordatum]